MLIELCAYNVIVVDGKNNAEKVDYLDNGFIIHACQQAIPLVLRSV